MTAGGLIGGNDKCCCENPPPPNCYCPDFCSYFIEVVSPSDLAVKSPANSCGGLDTTMPNTKVVDGWRFSDDLGEGYELYEDAARVNLSDSFARSFINAGLGASVMHLGNWRREFPIDNPFNPSQPFTGYAYAGFIVLAEAQVACNFYQGAGEAYTPTINILFTARFVEDGPTDVKSGAIPARFESYYLGYNVYFPLPVDCIYNESRSCFRPPYWHPRDGFHHVRTPLDVVVQKDKVTIGDVEYPLAVVPLESTEPGLSRAPLVDEVVDAFSATFRITSRDNCEPVVVCNCDSITRGLTITIYKAPFAPQVFVWNEEEQYATYSDLANFYSISYGPAGAGNEALIVMEQWNLSVTEIQFRWTIRIFCEAVPSGIPSPYRWYVSSDVECFEWDSGTVRKNTKHTYMGWMACEADPCGTNGREKDDLYPAGGVSDWELVSTVTPEGYEPCALPPFIYTIFVDNYAECP
jgi:hypothetical protein